MLDDKAYYNDIALRVNPGKSKGWIGVLTTIVNGTLTTFGDSSFAVAGPKVWSGLLMTQRLLEITFISFCRHYNLYKKY